MEALLSLDWRGHFLTPKKLFSDDQSTLRSDEQKAKAIGITDALKQSVRWLLQLRNALFL